MRTRSRVSSDTKKKKDAEMRNRKRKRTTLGDAGDRSTQCKIASRSIASQVKFPPKNTRHSSAGKAAEGLFASSTSKNGDDEVFAMTLEKFVGALRKRGAALRSTPNATAEKSRASLKKAIAKKHGTKESPVLIQPRKQGQSCDHAHALDDHQGRDNEKSTEEVAIEQCSSRNKSSVKRRRTKDSPLLRRDHIKHHEENMLTQQGGIDGQGNLTSTNYGEVGLQIVGTPLSTQELAGVQCQSHQGDHHNEPDATLSQGKTEKRLRSRHKDGGSMPTQVSQQLNSCYSRKRLNGAKSRWKSLAGSILSTKISPEILASASKDLRADFPDVGEQIRSGANSQNYKTQSLPKKRRKPFNALVADQRPVAGRMRQKVRKQQLSLQKRMKTWLTEAKFSQSAKEETSNDVGEEFIITQDERHAFSQSMVKSCQKNPNMRTVFLESVKMLTLSGLMQAAASNLLQQGPCEEAQNVMNAWADFKEQNVITKTLPVNLLNSVNQLHEKRGDLSTKLNTPNVVGICKLSQIDEQSWKFQLPGLPLSSRKLEKVYVGG